MGVQQFPVHNYLFINLNCPIYFCQMVYDSAILIFIYFEMYLGGSRALSGQTEGSLLSIPWLVNAMPEKV